jgi:hypothetical protein
LNLLYALTPREDLLNYLPKGGVGVEIGVAEGNFSEAIMKAAEPTELHLIDPWSHLENGDDLLAGGALLDEQSKKNASGAKAEAVPVNNAGARLHAEVVKRFEGEPRVRVHRQYSYKIAPQFPDGSLDFVYLDGNHTYEFVLRDLHDFAAKLKPGGLMFGHDFFENDFARQEHYGVMDAVGTFLKRTNYRFFMLSWEHFSTFFLAERLDGFAGQFLQNVLNSEVSLIELPDALASSYRDKAFKRQNGSEKRIPSFVNAGFQLR